MILRENFKDVYKRDGVVIALTLLYVGLEACLISNYSYLDKQLTQYVSTHESANKFFKDMETYYKNGGLNWSAMK